MRISVIVIFETEVRDSHQEQGSVCAVSWQEILIKVNNVMSASKANCTVW